MLRRGNQSGEQLLADAKGGQATKLRPDLPHYPSPRLPPLRICERAPRGKHSLSIEVSKLIEGNTAELARLRQKA